MRSKQDRCRFPDHCLILRHFSIPVKIFLYRILAFPIYLVMLLPMPLLYVISDFFFVLLFHVLKYRRNIVHTNLRNAFPEKTEKEIAIISRKYYAFMVDVFIETFKLLTISRAELEKRVIFENIDEAQKLIDRNQNFLYVMGHCGNWEWCGQGFQLKNIVQLDTLYHPLGNSFFDWLTMRLRTRWGMHVIPMNASLREMFRRKNIL